MVSVQLNDAIAAALHAKAAAQGMTVQTYLEKLLFSESPRQSPRLSLEEFDRLLDEEATAGHSPSGSFSRAELYSDHD